jgi:carbon storage regulator
MLVLSRKAGEKVIIGDGITVTVLEVIGNRIRIGIEAPNHIRILRAELLDHSSDEPLDPDLVGKPDWSATDTTHPDVIATADHAANRFDTPCIAQRRKG